MVDGASVEEATADYFVPSGTKKTSVAVWLSDPFPSWFSQACDSYVNIGMVWYGIVDKAKRQLYS